MCVSRRREDELQVGPVCLEKEQCRYFQNDPIPFVAGGKGWLFCSVHVLDIFYTLTSEVIVYVCVLLYTH